MRRSILFAALLLSSVFALGAGPATKPADAVKAAIRHHQILKGMTEAQVKEAMTFKSDPSKAIWDATADASEEEDDTKRQVWHVGYQSPAQPDFVETRTVRLTLKRGVVVEVSQTRNEDLDREPEGK